MIIKNTLSVGIIGGTGKTGSQFVRLFRSLGFAVRVTGEKTKAKNQELLRRCDIVIFALPLSSSASTIRKEVQTAKRKDQLFLDVSSLKSTETKAMLLSQGEVIGMHPLFGPATDPKGELILLCPARAKKETVQSLRTLFKKVGIRTKIMTPEKHDDLMATVQVVPHLKSFLMADALRLMNTDLSNVLSTCTPIYKMEFNVIARFLDDHPDLYMPIIFRNPKTVSLLKILRRIIDAYLRIAESGDINAAEKRYVSCKKLFQPFLKRARKKSELCIRTLLSQSR